MLYYKHVFAQGYARLLWHEGRAGGGCPMKKIIINTVFLNYKEAHICEAGIYDTNIKIDLKRSQCIVHQRPPH